jgi:hypothetical protein
LTTLSDASISTGIPGYNSKNFGRRALHAAGQRPERLLR